MNYVVSKCIKCNNKIINIIISFLIVNNYNKYIYICRLLYQCLV